ncbi:sigma-70 family RNA polymerase sigma factor [Nocardioides humilatus]|uniref:Sigma-70 family RNA polymerase sigma factor n=1 Tax=Nocardioides humilatus TaxID=2607660 RepID=A0A5B1L5Q4_9ACTN|nr:sigma-70 family RNA polymerase sigma factor [Nocardioides humilatus]KAA1415845.1 sigma-70 family RNA polymerase sigma factor [Nocardioides humilatus]
MPDPDLIQAAASGDGAARSSVVTDYAAAGSDERVAILDALAVLGAAGAVPATEVLLELVHKHRIAQPAITSLLVDPADIEDAAQLTLITVMEKIAQFEGRSRFQTWVRAIARNEALQVLRRKQRKSEPTGDEVPELAAFSRRLSSVVADEHAVRQALERVPEPYREALVLREFDGLGYDEIAERLGVPVGTVRSRIARARDLLAKQTWHFG